MLQWRFQYLKNDLLEHIVDVSVYMNILKGFNCLNHQDSFSKWNTLYYIFNFKRSYDKWRHSAISVWFNIRVGACWSSYSVWSQKKSFSTFALSVSSVKISPSFSSVGIEEFEKGDIKDFKIDHQSLDERLSDFDLSDNWLKYMYCCFDFLRHLITLFLTFF